MRRSQLAGNIMLEKESSCDRCQKGALVFDLYRRPFRLFLPDEQAMYRTLCGAGLSIFTMILMISYASWKLLTMFSRLDYKVQVHDQENFYSYTQEFSVQDGFMIAAAVTAYDGNQDDITDETIGRLKFVRKTWDGEDSVDGELKFVEIETVQCDQDYLLGAEASFYELDEGSKHDAKTYAPKMLCAANPEDLYVQG